MRLEEGHESRCELRVILQNINDRRGIDEDKCVLQQIANLTAPFVARLAYGAPAVLSPKSTAGAGNWLQRLLAT